MTIDNQDIRFEEAWLKFVESIKKIVGPLPDERGMDQFLDFRDKVLKMLENPMFLMELKKGFDGLVKADNGSFPEEYEDLGEALILELMGFSKGVEVDLAVKSNDKPKEKRKWGQKVRNWLGRGSTVTKSVKDLLVDLPSWAKGTLTILTELLDLFKR